MKNRNLTSKMVALALATAGLLATGCSKSEGDAPTPLPQTEEVFHVAYGVGTGGQGSTSSCVIKPFTDLKSGTISIGVNSGYTLDKSRTHRLYSSADGKYIYNLEYQNAFIKKYESVSLNDPFYREIGKKNMNEVMATKGMRWKKVNETDVLMYSTLADHPKKADGTYSHTTVTLTIVKMNLSDFSFVKKAILLPAETDTALDNLYIWRVDSPVVFNGKVYIGVAKQGYDGAKPIDGDTYKASTLVLDYPSLENPKIIYSDIATGEGYGYRTPAYMEYAGSIYHVTTNPSKILKITNGAYDNTYDFDLATALGMNKVGASGMFHAGNGIAYVAFYDAEKGNSWGSNNKYWGIARVDLNAKTAIKMDLPENLWLAPMQNAKVGKDGKVYMTIAPLNTNGNIYIFDPKSTSPTGYIKGATLPIAGDAFYLGVF